MPQCIAHFAVNIQWVKLRCNDVVWLFGAVGRGLVPCLFVGHRAGGHATALRMVSSLSSEKSHNHI